MINAETFLPHHTISHVLKSLLQAKLLLTKLLTFLTLQSKASERELLLIVCLYVHTRVSVPLCVYVYRRILSQQHLLQWVSAPMLAELTSALAMSDIKLYPHSSRCLGCCYLAR